jgi:hypothetical protein
MIPWAEQNHGRHAVYIATQAQIFYDDNMNSGTVDLSRNPINNAMGDSLQKFVMWKAEMDDNVNQQNSGTNVPAHPKENEAAMMVTTYDNAMDNREIFPYDPDAPEVAPHSNKDSEASENVIPPMDPS